MVFYALTVMDVKTAVFRDVTPRAKCFFFEKHAISVFRIADFTLSRWLLSASSVILRDGATN
jgi:hypothetical protein